MFYKKTDNKIKKYHNELCRGNLSCFEALTGIKDLPILNRPQICCLVRYMETRF